MKLVKMSLAAAVLLGASAFAIDNVKVSGDAKLFYGTNDMGDASLFEKGDDTAALTTGAGAYADTALRIGVTGDLLKGVSFGVTGYAVSTLGLENNLVSQTWTGAHGVTAGTGSSFATVAGGAQVDDAAWMGEAWMATTLGKTTVKLGRMELDTPLAFTEKWSVVPNTFEAAVAINQDLPDTTLVGAWVGKHNSGGHALLGGLAYVGAAGVVGESGKFNTFGPSGAYAAGIVNNSFKPLVAQAWYYDVVNVAQAYWLQADWDCQLVKGAKLGAQYTSAEADAAPSADLNAYAFKVGYEGVPNLKVSAAYSQTSNDGAIAANVATGATAQSKLYTESWWTYGQVGAADTTAWNLTAEYDAGIAKLGAYYTNADHDASNTSMDEVALTATKSFGPLDATLAYINTDISNVDSVNTLQAYLTLNF